MDYVLSFSGCCLTANLATDTSEYCNTFIQHAGDLKFVNPARDVPISDPINPTNLQRFFKIAMHFYKKNVKKHWARIITPLSEG